MLFDYKLAIVLIFVGLSNLLLSDNRNWIFGYRSSWSLKSHKHYDFANRIAGISTFLFGLVYFAILLYGDDYLNFSLEGIPKRIVFFSYFLSVILFIELRLRQKFRGVK